MKSFILKFKNSSAKLLLSFLGFSLAATQCLAQYMAYFDYKISGKLKGVTDTISHFRIIINNKDTLYSTWDQRYTFNYKISPDEQDIAKIEVSEDVKKIKQKYKSVNQEVAIKRDDDGITEVVIELEKKH